MIRIFCFFCILFSAITASAEEDRESVSSCHCFQERAFNPQKKFAADEYLLTTNFNSFVAASFHISKSQIVMMKMKDGVDPNDLLIALYVARACQVQLVVLLGILDNGGTWQQIFQSQTVLRQGGCDNTLVDLADIVAGGGSKDLVGEHVTDQLVSEYFGVSKKDIDELRKKGANGREVSLLFNLERYGKMRKNAVGILAMYKQQGMSWGEISRLFGLSPEKTGKLFLDEEASVEME